MAEILTGDVEVVRVDELLDVAPANIRAKKFLTDLVTDDKSAKVTVPNLESVLIHDNVSQKNIAAIGQSYGHIDAKQPFVFPTLTTTERDAIGSPNTSMKIYNSTTAQFEKWSGTAWVVDSAAVDLSTVGTGGDYATISAAITAGKYNLKLISNVTEVADITINTHVNINLDNYQIDNIAYYYSWNSGGRLNIKNGSILFNPGTTFALKLFSGFNATGRLFAEKLHATSTGTGNAQYMFQGGVLTDCIFTLPNTLSGGLTNSTATRCTFEGSGTNCEQIAFQSTLNNCILSGTFDTSASLMSECTIFGLTGATANGSYVSNCKMSNVYVTNLVFLSDCVVTGFSAANMHVNGIRNKLVNGEFSATSTINDDNSLINIEFAGDITIDGDNVSITEGRLTAGTITVDATADKTILIGNRTLSNIVDNGTNTEGSTGTLGNVLT